MIKLNIHGSIFGIDGYSNHTRSLFNALDKEKELDIKLNTMLPEDWMKQVNDAELKSITKEDRKEDWNLIITIPHMWKLFTGLGKNAAYCVWEGDTVPKSFLYDMNNPKIDLIFVPSQHTKDAIINTIRKYPNAIRDNGDMFIEADIIEWVNEKIRVIPHGVNREIFHSQHTKPAEAADAGIFKFMCSKGWRGSEWDRGGVAYLLRAFASEFSKEEKVQLILKLNPSYIKPEMIKQSVDALSLPEDRAPININCGILSPEQLNDLYNSADCFVCATRGEAFNLPGLEAMSCGLPTIQTAFGGQLDYMTSDNSLFIDWTLSKSEEKPMYEGINWAVPLITSLRKQLRWAFDNQDKIKEMGKQAEEDSKKWSWDNSAKEVLKNLK